MRTKTKRIICILLILILTLGVSACSSGNAGGSKGGSGKLDLDYEEGRSPSDQTEEKQSSGSWISEAFNFGKKESDTAGTDKGQTGTTQSPAGDPENDANNNKAPGGQMAGITGQNKDETGTGSSGNTSQTPKNQQTSRNNTNNTPADSSDQSGKTSDISSKKTVTITIRCDTAVKNGMHMESKWAGIVPASGCILPVVSVEFEEGDSVFDILAAVCSRYKLHMSYRGGMASGCYVEGINNLYEFDGGRWSGWMYCVNKWYPNYGCGVYYVKAGDEIEWNYTCDLGLDLEGGDILGGKDWKDTHD